LTETQQAAHCGMSPQEHSTDSGQLAREMTI
jgi:hypothetical protein